MNPPAALSKIDFLERIRNVPIEAVVIGASAGGVEALKDILSRLPHQLTTRLVIVLHIGPSSPRFLSSFFDALCPAPVREAEEKEAIEKGVVYLAPADYHLLIERDSTFSLSIDPPVAYSRPSIDVLFETAAPAYKSRLLGILLSGANADGAQGLRRIRDFGGFALAQDPDEAGFKEMPQAGINLAGATALNLKEITNLLSGFSKTELLSPEY